MASQTPLCEAQAPLEAPPRGAATRRRPFARRALSAARVRSLAALDRLQLRRKAARMAVMPTLRYRNVPAAIAWLCAAFGMEVHRVVAGESGAPCYAELKFGGNLLMIAPIEDTAFGRLMVQPDEIGGVETQISLPPRRGRGGPLCPRQGGGRRDRAGHRGRGQRRARVFLPRPRGPRVELRDLPSLAGAVHRLRRSRTRPAPRTQRTVGAGPAPARGPAGVRPRATARGCQDGRGPRGHADRGARGHRAAQARRRGAGRQGRARTAGSGAHARRSPAAEKGAAGGALRACRGARRASRRPSARPPPHARGPRRR